MAINPGTVIQIGNTMIAKMNNNFFFTVFLLSLTYKALILIYDE